MLELKQLMIGYRRGKELRRLTPSLSFSAEVGELTALVGPNGVGKSTLLKTLARQHPPLEGHVIMNGHRWDHHDRETFARICSYVPSGMLPVSRMSVFDTVAMARYPYTGWRGQLTARDREIVEQALERVGMLTKREEMTGELSDGERQRTLVARALAQGTQVVLLDEPTAFLDIPNRYELLQTMRELSRTENKLFIFSSHDLEFLLGTADRIWLLYPGAAWEGCPEDLLMHRRFDPLFRNTGIRYDPEKGLLIPHPSHDRPVVLSGRGTSYQWLKKALERSGYIVSDSHHDLRAPEIYASEEGFVLEQRGERLTFDTILELLVHLRKEK